MANQGLVRETACAVVGKLKQGEITPLDLLDVLEKRIAEVDRHVNALPTLCFDRARDHAKALMQKPVAERGLLAGLPVPIKDLTDVGGVLTTQGSPIYKDRIPARSDVLVERIEENGGLIYAKSNTPEFGAGANTFNEVFGATVNPWDTSRSAAGSSGGAAVALATGMAWLAHGSDMGGSLRNPAAFNNVIGLRPSRGRVPGSPDEELFLQQLGCEGPMARTVEDAARLLAVQAGFDPRVPLSLEGALPSPDALTLEGEVKGLRIGWLGSIWDDLPLAPGVRELCERGLQTFRDLGCVVEPCRLDVPREQNWTAWLRLRQMLVGGKLGAAYADPALRERLKPEARWEVEQSLRLDAAAIYQASVYRSNVYRAFLRAFESFDFVVAPTAQVFPFDARLAWPDKVGDVASDTYHRWMEIVTPFTLAGVPALNVRAGFGEGGLPMGIQIAGPIHSDMAVLRLGHAYDRACGWSAIRPPVVAEEA